jgi:hypothetical protein
MLGTRYLRRVKVATLTMLTAGSMLYAWGCTLSDVRSNVIAGTLGFVENSAYAFWDAVLPVDEWLAGGDK